jgi:hypothetical protein
MAGIINPISVNPTDAFSAKFNQTPSTFYNSQLLYSQCITVIKMGTRLSLPSLDQENRIEQKKEFYSKPKCKTPMQMNQLTVGTPNL